LIVHLAGLDALEEWAREIPAAARLLAERFWPGPLTIILKQSKRVAPAVTAGLGTVGLRVPAHPLALALLQRFQGGKGGLAAPSANRYGKVSPTTAAHVQADLGQDVPMVLDGGACAVGLESTVLDLSGAQPVLLRPGGVTLEALEAALQTKVACGMHGPVKAPGMSVSHYAPGAQVLLVTPAELPAQAQDLLRQGQLVAVLGQDSIELPPEVLRLPLSEDPVDAARSLYAALRETDRLRCSHLLVVLPPESGLGFAIADRLRRAAAPRP
jgi:L-threonylcarbamoyladenylate synthase